MKKPAKPTLVLLLATGFLFSIPALAAEDLCAVPVATEQGQVAGAADPGLAACSYKGIPYAAPPKGELRWKAPEPPAARAGVFKAKTFGPSCMQERFVRFTPGDWSFSEDCLTLNIYRPARSGTFPVMFWIHGGGGFVGGGRDEVYQGARLAAEREVVVVTINYRLDALGLFALPELASEDPNGSAGNYGLLDTIQALKWVRDNIAGFGGDPKNVTIFGWSAGGVSVCILLAAPPAAGLFHRGIIESGPCDYVFSQAKGYEGGKEMARTLGCPEANPLPCLRAKPFKELIAARNQGLRPLVHGYLLPAKPIDLFQQGKFNRVPVMVGSNKDEANFGLLWRHPLFLPRGAVTKQLQKFWGPRTGEILKMYSYDDYRWPVELGLAARTDSMHGNAFAVAEALSPQTPVYGYRFDWDEERRGKKWGAFHGLEVPLVFGNLNLKLESSLFKNYPIPQGAKQAGPLSEQMMSYWTNFAKNGDPNGQGLPSWPVYHPAQKELIHLDIPVSTALLTASEIQRYQYFASLIKEEGCPETVATQQGPVKGFAETGIAACSYKGIPYAAPPVGELRFRLPGPPAMRTGTLAALDYGPSCVQNEIFGAGGKSQSFSEDCLFLNIWRPQKTGAFPVMVWIHGGGFVMGSGSYEMYRGANLAAQHDVVVVTINYRVGPLSFLALPELAQEDPNGSTGNYGLFDQIAALQWVHDNIANFAGDPDNVTIFGESAGGRSVCGQLASPRAAGLFQRAIIESGRCDDVQTLAQGFENSREFVKKLGCAGEDARSCLRALPANKLATSLGARRDFEFTAHMDGWFLTARPSDLFAQGKFNRVPVLIGNNRDEGKLFVLMEPGGYFASRKKVLQTLKERMGPRADEVLAMYSLDDYHPPIMISGAIITDTYVSRGFDAAEKLSPYVPVYYYRFDWDEERGRSFLGACHGLELPFVFGNLDLHFPASELAVAISRKAAGEAESLSERMTAYWTNFAKTGDPNGAGLPEWPRYNPEQRMRLHLDTNLSVRPVTGEELKRLQYFAGLSVEELGRRAGEKPQGAGERRR
jgi:para-nitrobenzyl esterase